MEKRGTDCLHTISEVHRKSGLIPLDPIRGSLLSKSERQKFNKAQEAKRKQIRREVLN
jgi:hypothetical protein